MRIQMKLALLVFLVLTGAISAVVWKTRALLVQDKLGFIADSAMKQVAPLKRLTQERLDEQKGRLVKFAAGRASLGAGRMKAPVDYDAIALVQLTSNQPNQWSPTWVEKQSTPKADLPAGFETTLLKSLPYARVRDGEIFWARLSDRQGLPLYALMVSVEIQGGAASGASSGVGALPDSVDYAAAPAGGGKKAVVVGFTSAAPLADLTEDYIGSTNTVYVIDDKGYVASHVNKAYLGSLFTEDPIVAEIINTKKASASGNYQDIERRDVLGHFERIDRTNLYAVISTPLAPTRELISLHMRTALTAAGAVGLLGLLITWLLGRNLVSQMEQTIATAVAEKGLRQPPSMPNTKASVVSQPTSVPAAVPVALTVAQPLAPPANAPTVPASKSPLLATGFVNVIKEPVLAILGHAQLVRSKAGDPQQVASHAESIEREARRAKEAIDRLTTWAEPLSPLRKIEPLDLKAIVEAVLAEHEEDFKIDGVFVARELHDVPKVRGTVEDIKVALANLFANACEAMRARSKKHLRVTLELNSQGVRLAVTDTGVGMTRDVKEQAFEPFFKSFETPGRIGLGLAMVQRAVKSMGGTCEIESTPGEGATFNLNLPVTAEDRQLFHNAPFESVAVPPPTPAVSAPAAPPTIERPKHVLPPLERTTEPPAGAAVVDRDDDAFDDEDEKFTNISLSAKEPLAQGTVMKTLAEIESEALLKSTPPAKPETAPDTDAVRDSGPEEFRVKVRRPRVRS